MKKKKNYQNITLFSNSRVRRHFLFLFRLVYFSVNSGLVFFVIKNSKKLSFDLWVANGHGLLKKGIFKVRVSTEACVQGVAG